MNDLSFRFIDEKINSMLLMAAENNTELSQTHFICAGYWPNLATKTLPHSRKQMSYIFSKIKTERKKIKLGFFTYTFMSMVRKNLLTKEEMEDFTKGNRGNMYINNSPWIERNGVMLFRNSLKSSVNDDCDIFFQRLLQEQEHTEFLSLYFLPKLTNEEKKLVETKSRTYQKTFCNQREQTSLETWPKIDVDPEKMKRSDSDSKFLYSWGIRHTRMIYDE